MASESFQTDCASVVWTYFLTMVFPMSDNKCLSNAENMKICFASNKSFSVLPGVIWI